jgi:hypothetical protein
MKSLIIALMFFTLGFYLGCEYTTDKLVSVKSKINTIQEKAHELYVGEKEISTKEK